MSQREGADGAAVLPAEAAARQARPTASAEPGLFRVVRGFCKRVQVIKLAPYAPAGGLLHAPALVKLLESGLRSSAGSSYVSSMS